MLALTPKLVLLTTSIFFPSQNVGTSPPDHYVSKWGNGGPEEGTVSARDAHALPELLRRVDWGPGTGPGINSLSSHNRPCGRCACMLSCEVCPTPCDRMDCSPPGSSVHGIFQAGTLEWVTVPFSRGSSRLRGLNHASPALAGGFFTSEPPGKPRYTSSFFQVET